MFEYLSIVIPHYGETEEQLFPTLASIATQIGINFATIEVILVHDGGAAVISADFVRRFSHLRIREIYLSDNRGPGIARQAGIGNAKGKYLMFIDAGDVLHSVGVLDALIQESKKSASDIVATKWLEECKDTNGKRVYITHEQESTWMHGKLIRRQTLIRGNIRHHPALRVHEDSYFLSVLMAEAKTRVDLDFISYVWIYNPKSITRRDNAIYSYNSMPTFVFAICESMKQVERRKPEQMEHKVVQLAIYCYFVVHRPEWQSEQYCQYAEQTEQALAINILPYWHYFESATQETISAIYGGERAKHFIGCLEQETLNAWLCRIGLKTEQS